MQSLIKASHSRNKDLV